MTLADFVWVFACGGYFGWTVRQIVDRQRHRRTAQGARSWLCKGCDWIGPETSAYLHSVDSGHTTFLWAAA